VVQHAQIGVDAPTVRHHRLIVDGVTVHHFPNDDIDVTSVALVFAAGARDETMPTFGSLHALEHLCLAAVRRTPLELNGSVAWLTTDFTASGRTELVGPWLTALCRVLAEPPAHQLAHEADVLDAESEGGGLGSPVDPLLLVRLGHRDLGLGAVPHPAARSFEPARLTLEARRCFTAGNAVLVVNGPLPDLHLPLPEGPPLVHAWPTPRRMAQPHAVPFGEGCVAVGLVLPPPGPARLDRLVTGLLEQRVTEVVRYEAALAYTIDTQVLPTRDGHQLLHVWAEPRRGQDVEATRTFLNAVAGLLRDGPSQDELDLVRERVLASVRGHEAEQDALVDDTLASLFLGRPEAPLDAAALRAVGLGEVTAHLAALAEDVLYLVPEEAEELATVGGLPTWSVDPMQPGLPAEGVVHRPPLPARLFSRHVRTVRLVITDEALWLRIENEVSRVRWAHAVAVVENPDLGETVLFDADGSTATVDARLRGSADALAEVRRRVPAERWFTPAPEPDEDEGWPPGR
jgi:hypothetical protein